MVNLMDQGSCTLGFGSLFVWVSGSWVIACDSLPDLVQCTYRPLALFIINVKKTQETT